jgi:polyphosphate kinase
MPLFLKEAIAQALSLPHYLIYDVDGPLGLVDYGNCSKLTVLTSRTARFFLPFHHCLPLKKPLRRHHQTDFVLYHPYDSFEVIIDLLKEASQDKHVQEICITMYRMDHKSPWLTR